MHDIKELFQPNNLNYQMRSQNIIYIILQHMMLLISTDNFELVQYFGDLITIRLEEISRYLSIYMKIILAYIYMRGNYVLAI
jgi:hypothetical protein